MVQPPVIVVPGITASNLEDFYPVPPESVWSAVLNKKHDRFALHPDNLLYEAKEPARVRAVSIFELVYEDLMAALREELQRDDEVTPVFPFEYDWRQDCRLTADLLDKFSDEVIARTKLLPHYRGEDFRVDMVGHSMGGLIIAAYLNRYGNKEKVRRVVSIGTPFQGAVDAVLKLIIGKGQLTGENPRDRERVTARTVPAIYQLLPSFDGAVKGVGGAPTDLFDPKTWQHSILKSLTRYIKQHKAQIKPEALLRKYLATAEKHRRMVKTVDLNKSLPEKVDGWLAIVGVGSPTQVEIETSRLNDGSLRFNVLDDKDDWSKDKPESTATGDGTVPFKGALPEFMAKEKVICVCPDDFSRWEIRDRLLAKAAGFHGFLPAVNLVQRLVTRFLREDYTGHVWAWKPPAVDKGRWSPPDWLEKKPK
ncbi:MAG: alpha/beta fold hydrolase [Desulfobacterales bacterium]|nr:alpha/beta fold hydrolase [Desulfobacterales bacterium]